MDSAFPPLCVVLVGPEQAANVGFVARTMACYRLSDLRIVGSPGIAADGAARKTGKAVPEVLQGARYFPSLADAVADCGRVYGFTRRSRDPSQRIEDLHTVAMAWRESAGVRGVTDASALVFGRESQGLFKEETLSLTHLVRIPLVSETLSLNVSHALAIGLHAFLGGAGESGHRGPAERIKAAAAPDTEPGEAKADWDGTSGDAYPTRGETALALERMLAALEAGGFFKGGKQEAQKESVRLLWQRLNPTRREFDFLSGLLRGLQSGR